VTLTTRTFEALSRRSNLTKAGALRESILQTISDTSDPLNAHPAYWAPFVVVGGLDTGAPP
jgi:CHAT domain-containing protein